MIDPKTGRNVVDQGRGFAYTNGQLYAIGSPEEKAAQVAAAPHVAPSAAGGVSASKPNLQLGSPSYAYTSVPGQLDYGAGTGGVKVGSGNLEGTPVAGQAGGAALPVQQGPNSGAGSAAGMDTLPASLSTLMGSSSGSRSSGGASSGSGTENPGLTGLQVLQAQTDIGSRTAEQQAADALKNQQTLDASRAATATTQQQNTINQIPQVLNMTSQPPVTYGGPVSSGAAGSSYQTAQDAALARAKDIAGQIAKSSLTALRDAHGQAGGGGGLEDFRTAKDVIAPAASGMGDINRQQLIDANNAAIAAANAQYTGGIEQRGQNMGLSQSLLTLLKQGSLY